MDQMYSQVRSRPALECFRIPDSSAAMHTCQRKKCCPSEFITLKEINHTLGCIFIICNNILNTSSKRCLNSDLIRPFIDLNDIRYNTDQTFLTFFIRHYLSDTVTISVIALCNILLMTPDGKTLRRQVGRGAGVAGYADPDAPGDVCRAEPGGCAKYAASLAGVVQRRVPGSGHAVEQRHQGSASVPP